MTTSSKTPAIVQCSLGDTGVPIPLKAGRRPREWCRVLLRIASSGATSRRATPAHHDLALDLRDGSADALRATLARLAERFQILALLPPFGASSQHLYLGQTIAGLSDAMALPGFSEAAFVAAKNRYLTRCYWQNAGLPTTAFSLIQFPSALVPAIADIGLPARLSPLHYVLPHLEAHLLREIESSRAYQLISRTLQRHALTHPASEFSIGEDPRTHHRIRFSFSTDQLAVAAPAGTMVEFTLIIRDGVPQTAAATPITQRSDSTPPTVKRTRIVKMAQLAIEGCVALGIKTGVVCCMIQHTADGDFLDGIIPNYIDTRMIPLIEENCKMSWPEILLRSIGLG